MSSDSSLTSSSAPPFAGARGARLAERSWSAAAPRAVLLHGVTSSSGSWWQIGPALAARGWDVRALDLPGHGVSPRRDGALLPEALAQDVESSLPDGPLDLLVGHSLGALVALELAARAPGRVRRLVLEEPPGPLSIDFATMAATIEQDARAARADPDAVTREVRAAYPRWHDADCRQAVVDLVAFDDASALAGLRRGAEWRTVALAAQVRAPTLVLLAPDRDGRYDEREDGSTLRRDERREFLAALAGADVRVLDTGHCIHRDDPAGWLAAVADFTSAR